MMKPLAKAALLSLSIFIVQIAPADPVDPQKAIFGAWTVDHAALMDQIDSEEDTAKKAALGRILSIWGDYIYVFRTSGALEINELNKTFQTTMTVRDDGVLEIESDQQVLNLAPTTAIFESDDAFRTSPRKTGVLNNSIPCARLLDSELVEGETLNQQSVKSIYGIWGLDQDRLVTMPWIESIDDATMQDSIIDDISQDAELVRFAIMESFFASYMEGDEELESQAFIVRGADEQTVAIALENKFGDTFPDLPDQMIRIDIVSPDQIDIWMRAKQLPFKRFEDMLLPD